ncbi:MAG: ATP-binding cassette domain-containing protein [Eubacteriales bacterium]|nr:ATP-binding cassette domain-containing protein [Eubacteriales bacterium]
MKVNANNISMKFMRQGETSNYFYGVVPQSLELKEGTLTAVCGRSGSGKTTLLNILAGLQPPTEGQVYHGDTDLYAMSDEALSVWRGTKLGVIPQGRAMLDTLTVMENILLPTMLHPQKQTEQAYRERAEALLQQLEIESLAGSYPPALSGGELRRAAIVRALLHSPELIFADEPTGDLDDISTRKVLALLREEADRGATVLMVTHDQEALQYADLCWRMDAGKIDVLRV